MLRVGAYVWVVRLIAAGAAVFVALACASGARVQAQPTTVPEKATVVPMASAAPAAVVTTRSAGVTQTAIEAPLPVGANPKKWATLSQVVCPSLAGCVATGSYNLHPASNQVGHLLALSKRGAKWGRDATPANFACERARLPVRRHLCGRGEGSKLRRLRRDAARTELALVRGAAAR